MVIINTIISTELSFIIWKYYTTSKRKFLNSFNMLSTISRVLCLWMATRVSSTSMSVSDFCSEVCYNLLRCIDFYISLVPFNLTSVDSSSWPSMWIPCSSWTIRWRKFPSWVVSLDSSHCYFGIDAITEQRRLLLFVYLSKAYF